MARLGSRLSTHRHDIVIIDDDRDLASSTRALLEREGHAVQVALEPEAGVELVRAHRPDLVLLDYLMPGLTGADVVRAIRTFDTRTQILLVTGYAEEQPGRRLLAELDIQGYHDKADGPDRLLVLVDAALKYSRTLGRLLHHQRRLARLAAAAPDISRLQPAEELFQVALERFVALMDGSGNALMATANRGLFVMEYAESGITVRAGTGEFAGLSEFAEIPVALHDVVRKALTVDGPTYLEGGIVCVPMCTRSGDRGCILVEAKSLPDADCAELCSIYSGMVVQALENLSLYERATHDPLCRIWNRSAGQRRLVETLQLAHREGADTAVLLLDVDHFKTINDRWGHAAGDLALVRLAQTMVEACRETDVVCRYGGEEFLVVLPSTDRASATWVAEKLRRAIASTEVRFEGERLPLTASVGVASSAPEAEWSPELATRLVRLADAAMYEAKGQGRDRVVPARSNTPA